MDITAFLEEHGDILLEEHKEKIIKYQIFLRPYNNMKKINSIFGSHYESCIWSYDYAICGPDTCVCHFIDIYISEIKKLVSLYERLKK